MKLERNLKRKLPTLTGIVIVIALTAYMTIKQFEPIMLIGLIILGLILWNAYRVLSK